MFKSYLVSSVTACMCSLCHFSPCFAETLSCCVVLKIYKSVDPFQVNTKNYTYTRKKSHVYSSLQSSAAFLKLNMVAKQNFTKDQQ